MLPACRTDDAAYTIPTFDVVPDDVEGFMDELWEFQAAFHDCFARSEPRAHFFDYMGAWAAGAPAVCRTVQALPDPVAAALGRPPAAPPA